MSTNAFPLAAQLVDLSLSRVALCGQGANSRADILLTKSRKENVPMDFETLCAGLTPEASAVLTKHIDDTVKAAVEAAVEKTRAEEAEKLAKAAPAEPAAPAAEGLSEDVIKALPAAVQEQLAKQQEQIAGLIAESRQRAANEAFEKCKAIPVEEATLKSVLGAASPAMLSVLEAASAAITKQALEPVGKEAKPGFCAGGYEALEKAAKSIQDTDAALSFEAAFEKACDANPAAYAQYLKEVRGNA